MALAAIAIGLLAVWTMLALEARAQTVTDASLVAEQLLPDGSLDQPTALAFLANDDYLVLEKTGDVRRVLNGVLQPNPVLSLRVNDLSERGLLGIAINHAPTRWVFLYFTEADASLDPIANRVYRYTWNPQTSSLVSPVLILDLPVTSGPNHNGGALALGPSGQFPGVGDGAALYAVIGDLNRNGQLQNNPAGAAPDNTGVILRVLQNGAPAPGNPFTPYCSVTTTRTCVTSGGCPAGQTCLTRVAGYFAYGVRNSFGLALDPVTGVLWDTENGPATYDEINRVDPGMNSGWNEIMGPDEDDPQGVGDLFHMPNEGLTYSDPEFSWVDTNAPTAILFAAGSALGPEYYGVALVGDVNTGQIYRFPLNASRSGFALSGVLADLVADDQAEANTVRWGQNFGGVTDLEIGPDGNLYSVDIGRGTVYRVRRLALPVPSLPYAGAFALAALLGLALALGVRRG